MASWSDYDDDYGGGVDFTLDMLNPFTMPSVYKFAQNPNSLTAVQVMYWPAITTASAYIASALAGSGNPYHWSMYKYLVADKYRMLANYITGPHPILSRVAPVVGVAVGGYELYSTATRNVGTEPVPHVEGAYTNSMSGGGSDDFYYPGKGIVDWVSSQFDDDQEDDS